MKLPSLLPIAWITGWAFAVLLSSDRGNNSVVLAWLSLIFGGSGFLIGVYVFSQGFRELRRKQQIANTPLSKIASAAIGPVEIYGRVTGPYTLLSPLAETDCYYYRTVALGQQDLQGHPAERVTESLYAPFYLEDETGRVMIDPRGAGLDLPAAYEEEVEGEGIGQCAQRFLNRHALSAKGVTSIREYAIRPGDSLFVVGHLRDNRGWTNMADAPPDAMPKSGEGYLSPAAADFQRREVLEAMGMSPVDLPAPNTKVAPGFDLHPRVVISRGDSEEGLFLLSHTRPERVINDLARRATLWIWGGPALGLCSLGLLLRALHLW